MLNQDTCVCVPPWWLMPAGYQSREALVPGRSEPLDGYVTFWRPLPSPGICIYRPGERCPQNGPADRWQYVPSNRHAPTAALRPHTVHSPSPLPPLRQLPLFSSHFTTTSITTLHHHHYCVLPSPFLCCASSYHHHYEHYHSTPTTTNTSVTVVVVVNSIPPSHYCIPLMMFYAGRKGGR